MKLTLKRRGGFNPGIKFNIDQQMARDVEAISVASIVRNVVAQKQASGAAMKRNAPSTLHAKRKAGHGTRSLVDALHRFVTPSNWGMLSWDGRVMRIGALSADLKRIVRAVLDMGYVGWLGIDAVGRKALHGATRAWIGREFARWRGKR